ncbi:MAG: DUF2096 family protein [Oscillospiraceae bacterium]|nr:DUF2096 family protein [Oscillospiraceae bacterium]
MTNYIAAAAVLDELMIELKHKNIDIPSHVVSDLKTGRSFAGIAMRQAGEIETEAKAMAALQNVEMNLLSLAEIEAGNEYAEGWQMKIIEAYTSDVKAPPSSSAAGYIVGIPKGVYWVRVQEEYLKDITDIAALLDEFTLSSKSQDDGYILVYGKKDNVSLFLASVREAVG